MENYNSILYRLRQCAESCDYSSSIKLSPEIRNLLQGELACGDLPETTLDAIAQFLTRNNTPLSGESSPTASKSPHQISPL